MFWKNRTFIRLYVHYFRYLWLQPFDFWVLNLNASCYMWLTTYLKSSLGADKLETAKVKLSHVLCYPITTCLSLTRETYIIRTKVWTRTQVNTGFVRFEHTCIFLLFLIARMRTRSYCVYTGFRMDSHNFVHLPQQTLAQTSSHNSGNLCSNSSSSRYPEVHIIMNCCSRKYLCPHNGGNWKI